MEPNNSVSDEAITTIDGDEQQQQQQNSSSTQTIISGTVGATAGGRSYECNFCKRGFTNAQALGGHMNIHRKHKAKLKQSSSSSTPPNTAAANLFSSSRNKPLIDPLLGGEDSRYIQQENTTDDSPTPVPEVDLELRLGHVQSPGRNNNKKNISATRKFF